MNEHDDDLGASDAALDAILARPEMWDEPPPGLEDMVVAAIMAEAAADQRAAAPSAPSLAAPPAAPSTGLPAEATDAPVTSLADRREQRAKRSQGPRTWLAIAAGLIVVVVGATVFLGRSGGDGDPEVAGGVEIVMEPTDAAPGASATVELAPLAAGLRIRLDAEGLEPAPEGYFYEAWVSNGEIRVSAGTFHLRNGDDPISLWAGVADPEFDQLSVTLEPLDGVADSSGDVRLRGTFDLSAADG